MATAYARRPKAPASRLIDMEKALPVKEEAEAAFLGSVMTAPGFALAEMRATVPNLAPRHFYSHTHGVLHRLIFTGILELEEAGQAIDPVTMADWLAEHGVTDGEQYLVVGDLSNAANADGNSANAGSYARIVYDNARQRAQIQTAYKMFQAAWAGDTDEYNKLTEKTDRLREDFVPAKERKLKTRSLRDIMATEYPEVRMLIENFVQQGVVTILAGKAKAGKSFWLLAAAIAIAEACQNAFQNVDEDGKVLYHGLHCEQSDVLYMALEDTERRIKNRVKKMRDSLPIPEGIDVATEAPRIDEGVIEQMESYLDEHPGCKLIIIDTLTSVLPIPKSGGGSYLEDRLNMQGLRDLAHRRDVAILPVLHCRKADGSDVFDTIQTTMGTQAGTENMIVLQRRRGEDRAILHATGNDLEGAALAMKWNKESCTWSILGDAEQVAENEQEELIFGAIEALEDEGKPAKLGAIAEKLKGEMAFAQVRTLLYRMSTVKPNSPVKNKLVNNGGVFSKNTKSENVENRENIEKYEKPEILFEEEESAAIEMSDAAFSTSQSFQTSQDSQHSQKLIDFDQLLEEVRNLWASVQWRLTMIAGALRGGSEWMANQCLQRVAERQDRAWLVEARQALQGAM